MKSILFNEKITENNYADFVEQLVNVFRLSSFERSILFSLKFEKTICIIQLSILNQDGNRQEYEEVHVDSSESFFNDFLEHMVSAFRNHCVIVKEDIVNLDNDEWRNERLICQMKNFQQKRILI